MSPPPEDRQTFARFVRDEARMAGLSPRLVAALRAGDEDEFNRIAGVVHAARNDRTRAAQQLGVTHCRA